MNQSLNGPIFSLMYSPVITETTRAASPKNPFVSTSLFIERIASDEVGGNDNGIDPPVTTADALERAQPELRLGDEDPNSERRTTIDSDRTVHPRGPCFSQEVAVKMSAAVCLQNAHREVPSSEKFPKRKFLPSYSCLSLFGFVFGASFRRSARSLNVLRRTFDDAENPPSESVSLPRRVDAPVGEVSCVDIGGCHRHSRHVASPSPREPRRRFEGP